MSILRSIEHKIEALLEGIFGRAFRTNVQPVELARKLAKEMDDHRTVSVSRVYVPNEYTVYLAPDDRAQFQTYESSLIDELREHLAEHARRERYALLSAPRVLIETDADLDVGEFGIATRMEKPEHPHPRDDAEETVGPGQTMVYKQAPVPTREVPAGRSDGESEPGVFHVNGEQHAVDKERVLIGRSRDCDIQISDPNVSRRHAEVRREGSTFWLVDLGSTNGVDVNGRRQHKTKLRDGDRITMGTTELLFTIPRP